jgi:hypothetical protein
MRVPERKQGMIAVAVATTVVVASVVGESAIPSVTDRVMPVVTLPPSATS